MNFRRLSIIVSAAWFSLAPPFLHKLENHEISNIRQKITQKTIDNLSVLVRKYSGENDFEAGGYVSEDNGSLVFHEVQNEAISLYYIPDRNKLEEKLNSIIADLEEVKKGRCAPLSKYYSDLTLYKEAKRIKAEIKKQDLKSADLEEFFDTLDEERRSTYIPHEYTPTKALAKFHTHSNSSPPSNVDLCFTQKGKPEFVISYDSEHPSNINVYFVSSGLSELVGTYKISPSAGLSSLLPHQPN